MLECFSHGFEYIQDRYDVNIFHTGDFRTRQVVAYSKKANITDTLLLGNSVGNQFYGKRCDKGITALTSTASISTIGQYLLLTNYLKFSSRKPKIVYLIMEPRFLSVGFVNQFSYTNFFKNFCNDEYEKYFTPEAWNEAKRFRYFCFRNQLWFRQIGYVPSEPTTGKDKEVVVNDITLDYFHKIKQICTVNNIEFKLVFHPVRISSKESIVSYFKQYPPHIYKELEDAYCNMDYWDDNNFIDGLHVKKPDPKSFSLP